MNGSTFRLTLVDTRQNILAKLSGCQAPLIPAVGRTEEPEPFAKDSKVFVEKYLLQRDVIFTPRGLCPLFLLFVVQEVPVVVMMMMVMMIIIIVRKRKLTMMTMMGIK